MEYRTAPAEYFADPLAAGLEAERPDAQPHSETAFWQLGHAAVEAGWLPPDREIGVLALPNTVIIHALTPDSGGFGTESSLGFIRDALRSAAETMGRFDNPQAEFTTEMVNFTSQVRDTITATRDARVARRERPEFVAPRGLKGVITRVIRGVRRLFDRLRGKPRINPEITAYDAAVGIEQSLQELQVKPEATATSYPLLAALQVDQLPVSMLPKEQLAFMAPEVLRGLFALDPEAADNQAILESVERHPHEWRFITRFKRTFGDVNLDTVQRLSTSALPVIRQFLPTDGPLVRDFVRDLTSLLPDTALAEDQPAKPQAKQPTQKWRQIAQRAGTHVRRGYESLRLASTRLASRHKITSSLT